MSIRTDLNEQMRMEAARNYINRNVTSTQPLGILPIINNSCLTTSNGSGVGGATSGITVTSTWPQINPNTHPALQISLASLVDLWRARYGDAWVDVTTPSADGDTFWPEGGKRLERSGRLEVYENTKKWLRIKEDV